MGVARLPWKATEGSQGPGGRFLGPARRRWNAIARRTAGAIDGDVYNFKPPTACKGPFPRRRRQSRDRAEARRPRECPIDRRLHPRLDRAATTPLTGAGG